MKKLLLVFGFAICSSLTFAQNGLEGIIVEKYYVADANDATGDYPVNEGSVTYRLYVDLAEGYNFQAVFGNTRHILNITTTTYFFNNEDRGNSSPTYTTSHAEDNTVMLDSWLSVGAAASGQIGVLKTEDDGVNTIVNADGKLAGTNALAGIPISQEDGMVAGSPGIVSLTPGLDVSMLADSDNIGGTFTTGTDGGAWYATPGTTGATSSNTILIGQFTTDGEFSFDINIQIGTPSGGTEKYVSAYHADDFENEIVFADLAQTITNLNAPEVSITSPLANAILTNDIPVNITANASDTDGTISSVEFFVDGTSIGSTTTSPYTVSYTPTNGTHVITAVATDNDDVTTTSTEITVTSSASTGIEKDVETEITVFPTIAHSSITIDARSSSDFATIEIVSLLGEVVFSKTYMSSHISDEIGVENLVPGQYFVTVIQKNKSISTTKIIKQ